MNSIEINIFTSYLEFKKIFIDLDNTKVTFNQKNVNMTKEDIILIVKKILSITSNWDKINLICINGYNKIEVKINFENNKKEYIFTNEVPIDVYEIYDLIGNLKVRSL